MAESVNAMAESVMGLFKTELHRNPANAMAESVMGLFKTELHRNPAALAANGGPWRGLDDLEIATCAWVSWFNEERLHSELGDHTPAEFEADYRQRSQTNAA
jgi:putative transposase